MDLVRLTVLVEEHGDHSAETTDDGSFGTKAVGHNSVDIGQ